MYKQWVLVWRFFHIGFKGCCIIPQPVEATGSSLVPNWKTIEKIVPKLVQFNELTFTRYVKGAEKKEKVQGLFLKKSLLQNKNALLFQKQNLQILYIPKIAQTCVKG